MPLSEREKRILEELERDLYSDEQLSKSFTVVEGKAQPSNKMYAIAGVGIVLGVVGLIVGVTSSQVWLGVIGFLIMFAAVAYAFLAPSNKVNSKKKPAAGSKPKPSAAKNGLADKLEERWNSREN